MLKVTLPKIIGHRGACGYAPENTLKSFRLAKQLGASMVEFDVCLSQDNIPVVMHDERIDRTTSGQGLVRELKCATLQTFDAGEGEKIPTLEETMRCLAEENLTANVEIKPCSGYEEEMADNLIQTLTPWAQKVPFVISSFSPAILKQLKEKAPEFTVAALFYSLPRNWGSHISSLDCISVNLHYLTLLDHAPKETIESIHQQGYKVLCYTVNDLHIAEKLFSLGVDGIFTNYIDRMLYCTS